MYIYLCKEISKEYSVPHKKEPTMNKDMERSEIYIHGESLHR